MEEVDLHSAAAFGEYDTITDLVTAAQREGRDIVNERGARSLLGICGAYSVIFSNICHKVGFVDAFGSSALMEASKYGHSRAVNYLLFRGADPNLQDANGRSALHQAAAGGYEDVARALLNAGADVRAADGEGRTALHWATEHEHDSLARMLITAGADPKAKDRRGRVALQWAAGFRSSAAVGGGEGGEASFEAEGPPAVPDRPPAVGSVTREGEEWDGNGGAAEEKPVE